MEVTLPSHWRSRARLGSGPGDRLSKLCSGPIYLPRGLTMTTVTRAVELDGNQAVSAKMLTDSAEQL